MSLASSEGVFRSHDDYRYLRLMAITIAALVLLIAIPFYLSPTLQNLFLDEGGPIQVFSAAGYLVIVTALVRELDWSTLRRHWYFLVVPLAMCLREMDFHAHFTTYSVTKTLLYVSPDVPLIEKAFGIAVFGVLGLAGYLLVSRHGRSFIAGVSQGNATYLGVAAAMISAVASKALDGAASNLAAFGITVEPTFFSVVTEEVLELGIPVFLAIAAFSFLDAKRALKGDRETRS